MDLSARLAGKKALVTGAGGALGQATAIRLAAEGAAVACCDLNQAAAESAAAAVTAAGGKAVAVAANVADPAQCEHMVNTAADAFGGLDVLFNNAGVLLSTDSGAVDTPFSTWQDTLAVNLGGVFLGCKYAIPLLQQAGGGSVINTASIVAMVGSAFPQLAYTASKGGVVALTRELAVQHAREGLRFNALCPGPIHTEMTADFFSDEQRWQSRRAFIPAGRLGTPEEIAAMVAFLAADESAFINGAVLPVDGAITAAYVASDLQGRLD